MTPMEELREQAAKIADDIEWLENFGLSLNCTVAENDRIRRIVKFARSLPAPVALPQAGEVEPVAWLYDGPDSEHYVREHRDLSYNWLVKNGWTETPLYASQPTPTETPTAAAPDEGPSDVHIAGLCYAITTDVGELPDRTSPEDQPDMMLVTVEELDGIVETRVRQFLASFAPDDGLMGRWMPIATAPKDGSRFYAVGRDWGDPNGRRHYNYVAWANGRWEPVDDDSQELAYLTHWLSTATGDDQGEG